MKNVHTIIVFGETKERLSDAAEKAGIPTIIETETITTAVPLAFDNSQEGDIILLSPACASWDQYKNFEIRGDAFIDAVHTLKHEQEEG
jgi:UDP-N-acetylmuramoylalanine--D-glutamate ligase